CLLPLLPAGFAAEPPKETAGLAEDAELVETRATVPKLKAPAAYEMKDNTVEIELSEYAGYAGLIAANNGLAPTEDSYFFKQYGFKVKFTLSEEDSWSDLNSGRLAASSTTADVLPLYGKQFRTVVPALISFSRGADGVVVRSSINTINDLVGKTLAASQFNEADFFIHYLVQEAGLEINLLEDFRSAAHPDKVNLIYCADAFGAGDLFLRDLKSGRKRLDGCVSWGPKTTEVVEQSGSKAKLLVTSKNILLIADVLLVNRPFAEKNPKIVSGLTDGLLYGNDRVRTDPKSCEAALCQAFKWDKARLANELANVHLANLPENLAFFAGTIDSAGSFGYIYESAAMAYGSKIIKDPCDAEAFLDLKPLKLIEKDGKFSRQKADIRPIRANADAPVENPLLARNIRFLFQPNSSKLDMEDKNNLKDLDVIAKMLQVSPGSKVLLRGHVDNSNVANLRKQGGEDMVRKMALKAIQLSKERAEEVKQVLSDVCKVNASRLDTIGCGWKEPVSQEMKLNRRVEVQWFTTE
ncbi:MAG: OmpA family protein, partial [Lentisphaerae bacterium]|nr:OmpA family protein [Lentisphaerota bacterium]